MDVRFCLNYGLVVAKAVVSYLFFYDDIHLIAYKKSLNLIFI